MVKLVYVIRAHPGISREEFHRYWREEHAPKVAAAAGALGARRYVQSHTLDSPLNDALLDGRGGMVRAFEGITEVWWDSIDGLIAALGTPEGQEAGAMLAADEAQFIDFEASSVFLTEEHEVFDFGAA